ncbi:MAG: lysophospholipid acyltransferase family protein [Deltaproteobacteria bacterium]|nr:lysophospholipid acyltransferase family protein [Deltaproteobacteria bacterium]
MAEEHEGLWIAWGLWFHFWLGLITISLGTMALLVSLFDPLGLKVQRLAKWWGRSLLFFSGVKVEVRGLEHLKPGETYVFAANHRSQFDIFVLLSILPGNFLFVAKKSLFQIPIFGQALTRTGSVPIDRSNRQEAIKSLNLAVAKVKQGFSMIVFPEGTRANSRELIPFKKGVFVMAMKAGQPVVPVAINGTMAIQPRGALRLHPGPIQVVLAPPVDPLRFPTKEALMAAVRREIAERFDPDYPRR